MKRPKLTKDTETGIKNAIDEYLLSRRVLEIWLAILTSICGRCKLSSKSCIDCKIGKYKDKLVEILDNE